jgi:hypothetical protein
MAAIAHVPSITGATEPVARNPARDQVRSAGEPQLDPSPVCVDSVAIIANAPTAICRKIELNDIAWVAFWRDDENLVKDKL